MAESSQVRLLQHHLRQAGTSLAARQYDTASTHIEAALAIDPASLGALTLRERLEAQRAQSQRLTTKPSSSAPVQPAKPETNRFVPAGVNAASWLDFEQRIQERRFRGLLDAAERAVAAGNCAAARAAIEEARELQPDSGEVVRLSARIAMLQIPAATPNEGLFRSRTFRAVSLLLLGVTLLMGLDWVRSGAKHTDSAQVAAATAVPEPVVVQNNETTTAPSAQGTSGEAPERLPLTYRSVATSPETPTVGNEPTPVAVDRAPATFELAENDATPSARLPPAAPIVRGEVSDDYVAPRFEVRQRAPEREQPAASAPRPPVTTAPLASVVRQPAPIFESIAPASTPAAAAAAPATIPPPSVTAPVTPPPAPAGGATIAPARVSEDSRVTAVLNQYASAYGQLDAAAVRSIWPSVNESALARAFANLSSQSMSFDTCDVNVTGATARASCRGRASYVPKIGSQEKHNEPRTVQFELKRDGDNWKITRAVTSR